MPKKRSLKLPASFIAKLEDQQMRDIVKSTDKEYLKKIKSNGQISGGVGAYTDGSDSGFYGRTKFNGGTKVGSSINMNKYGNLDKIITDISKDIFYSNVLHNVLDKKTIGSVGLASQGFGGKIKNIGDDPVASLYKSIGDNGVLNVAHSFNDKSGSIGYSGIVNEIPISSEFRRDFNGNDSVSASVGDRSNKFSAYNNLGEPGYGLAYSGSRVKNNRRPTSGDVTYDISAGKQWNRTANDYEDKVDARLNLLF